MMLVIRFSEGTILNRFLIRTLYRHGRNYFLILGGLLIVIPSSMNRLTFFRVTFGTRRVVRTFALFDLFESFVL